MQNETFDSITQTLLLLCKKHQLVNATLMFRSEKGEGMVFLDEEKHKENLHTRLRSAIISSISELNGKPTLSQKLTFSDKEN